MQRRRNLDYYVWLAHRITGVILLAYLFVHLWTLSAVLEGADSFDSVMESFRHPLLRLLELGLVGLVVFHTLNGIRLIFLDFFPESSQRVLTYTCLALSATAVLCSIPFFFEL